MNRISKYLITAGAVAASMLPAMTHAMGMYDDGYSSGGALAGFAVFFAILMTVFWIGIILLWVFWLLMIIDVVRRDWKRDGDKAAYLILVIFLNILGAIIYYFAVKRHLDKK
jgi:hypothetical protein